MYLSTGDMTAITIALCTASFVIVLGLIRIYVLERRLQVAKRILNGLVGALYQRQEDDETKEFNAEWEHYFNGTGRWSQDD